MASPRETLEEHEAGTPLLFLLLLLLITTRAAAGRRLTTNHGAEDEAGFPKARLLSLD